MIDYQLEGGGGHPQQDCLFNQVSDHKQAVSNTMQLYYRRIVCAISIIMYPSKTTIKEINQYDEKTPTIFIFTSMRLHLISRLRSRTRSKGRFVKCTSPPSPLLEGTERYNGVYLGYWHLALLASQQFLFMWLEKKKQRGRCQQTM